MLSASQHIDKSTSWAQSGIRKEVNFARVLGYDHGDIFDTTTIKQLAENILRVVASERNIQPYGMEFAGVGQEVRRPLFFICHSLGGLVVKFAMIEARRNLRYRKILEDCYGLTFFATPHKGSSYFPTTQYDARIQQLLGLSEPLPGGIAEKLTPNHHVLLHNDGEFKKLASEVHIWTLYEMGTSQSSRYPLYDPMDAQIEAPFASMKSAILGLRHEELYPLRSSHANCASFGMKNYRTMRLYLKSLGNAIRKAEGTYNSKLNKSLNLEQRGLVQVHGFWLNFRKPRSRVSSAECTMEEFLTEGLMQQTRKSRAKDASNLKFAWIHQSFNNPAWVRSIFDRLSTEMGVNFSQLFNSKNWTSRQEGRRGFRPHAWFMKPSCDWISLYVKPFEEMWNSEWVPSSDADDQSSTHGCIHLYMPFLHFDTYKAITERRRLICRRLSQKLRKPVPIDVARNLSLEMKMIWEYVNDDPPINIRRTLDQFQHPSLPDTKARDDDQVLYKMTKERFEDFAAIGSTGSSCGYNDVTQSDDDVFGRSTDSLDELDLDDYQLSDDEDEVDGDDILNGNVLMVDQLWLWVINDESWPGNVVTCFPRREGDPMDGPLFNEADLHNSIFDELHGPLSTKCENGLDLAALIVLHAVTVLLGRSSNPDLEVFRIFEEALSLLTDRMTRLLKVLEASAWGDIHGLGDNMSGTKMPIHEGHKLENARARRENRINTSTLLALRDIEDELAILKRLFSEQEQQINKMLGIYETIRIDDLDSTCSGSTPAAPSKGQTYLQEALAAVQSYQVQIEDMSVRTRKVLLDFDRLLDLLERRAQGEEGRLSRHHADLGAAQNRIVLIFTIFTVIFLPLSFFTSLFGMNTREWGGGDNLTLSTIGLIALPTSAVVIIGAIIIAWVLSGSAGFPFVGMWRKKYTKFVISESNSRPRISSAQRKSNQKHESPDEIRKREKRKKAMMMVDFWDSHRLHNHYNDDIPLENRRGVRIAMARAKAMKEQRVA